MEGIPGNLSNLLVNIFRIENALSGVFSPRTEKSINLIEDGQKWILFIKYNLSRWDSDLSVKIPDPERPSPDAYSSSGKGEGDLP
jgi:hypothetical protein